MFVLCILNEIISIFGALAEITGEPAIKKMIKGITNLFSVDTYVFFPVESICAIYTFIFCIINEIISIFGTLAEITGKPAIKK